jgi:cytochrome c
MTTLRILYVIALGLLGAVSLVTIAGAQMPLPTATPPDGATLFKQQCATCHTSNESDPVRQGPSLFNVVGRRAGSMEGFKYSAGFAKADFVLDEARIDAWIINPQEMIPGSVMAYRQARPEVRAAIIAYLKELK